MMNTSDALKFWLVAAAVAAGFVLFWLLRDALVLAFAAIVLAILLDAVGRPLRGLGANQTVALTVVCVAIILSGAALVLLVGSQFQTQASDLFRQLPQGIRALEERLGVQLIGQEGAERRLFGHSFADVLQEAASLGRMAAGVMTSALVIAIGAVFLAASPHLYRVGFVKLFPVSQHGRIEGFLDASGRALQLWLIGQLISMTIVGVLVGLGAWLIGLPAPLVLGLVAGLMEFIPVIGPVLGAVPAVLLAITVDMNAVLWTLGLFFAVQQVESNVITPIVQRSMVEIPPALLLLAVVVVGLIFGPSGLLFAAPITVAAFVAVKKLYVRETLGIDTPVPGEPR
jgi:predicted PurR-regulated permease PerM